MDGYDIQRFKYFEERVKDNNIVYGTRDSRITLQLKDNTFLGVFGTLEEAISFIFGFEWGRETITRH